MTNNDSFENTIASPAPYAAAIIRLLHGPIYSDDHDLWELILRYYHPITYYFAIMGVTFYLNEGEGFAYLTQIELENENGSLVELPRLTYRREIPRTITLLLVLLREALNNFEQDKFGDRRLIIVHEDLIDMMRPFYLSHDDERTAIKQMNSDISSVVELGFIKKQESENKLEYLVRSILKARVSSSELESIKRQLEQYADNVSK
jgi:hypothetical protein